MEDVVAFIEDREGKQKAILQFLHQRLMAIPGVSSKIRYRVPFYYKHSWICYLNPVKDAQIELSFLRANEMAPDPLLDFKGRKQVASILLSSPDEINESVERIIQEAFLLDEQVPYASKRQKK